MRAFPIRFLAVASIVGGASAMAQEPADRSIDALFHRVVPRRFDDAELAGVSKDAKLEPLTWDRAYGLALIRARSPKDRKPAEAFDPRAFEDQSRTSEVADFDRFRKEFLADPNGEFRDPSRAMLGLLATLQSIENSARRVAALEGTLAVLQELIKGESSGLDQSDLERASVTLERARLDQAGRLRRFRDGLDALKVELGLSPHAAVALDRESLAGFHAVFEAVTRWSADPSRELQGLAAFAQRLPTLPPLMIDDRPAFTLLDREPEVLEDLLRTAARVALARREGRDDEGRVELRVRGLVRELIETRHAYQLERLRFLFVFRQRDQAIEGIIAPLQFNRNNTTERVRDLIDSHDQALDNQDRLVSLWSSYLANRLELDRTLGSLPARDWKTFHNQFRAVPAEPDRDAAPLRSVPAPLPPGAVGPAIPLRPTMPGPRPIR